MANGDHLPHEGFQAEFGAVPGQATKNDDLPHEGSGGFVEGDGGVLGERALGFAGDELLDFGN